MIEPDNTPSAFILSLIVVSIEDVNEFNEPVEPSTLVNRLFCVLLIVVIEPLKSLILVDIDELTFVMVVPNPNVVVAIDALIFPTLLEMDELKLLIVDVTDELKLLISFEMLELNVEYPVVPVIDT